MKTRANHDKRGLLVFGIIAVLALLMILWIGYIQIVKGEEYTAKVEKQMLSDNEIRASRGTIYDANMNVIAQSASVWCVYMRPARFESEFSANEREIVRDIVAGGLATLLDLDEETLRGYTERSLGYLQIKRGIEKDTKEAVERLIAHYAKKDNGGYDLSTVIGIDPDVKRYYPSSSFASTVVGFTGSDGDGLAGIEYYYNDLLKGTAGRTITAVDSRRIMMPNQYETIFEAKPGTSLVLSIDMYVQYILEDVLSQAMEDTQAESIYGIVMDVTTGAVRGMVSLPDYDLNNPFTLKSETLNQKYIEAASAPEDESESKADADKRKKSYYQNQQWNNRAITSTYEPGSVFKVVTASAAIEEGVANVNRSFFCNGVIEYATRRIKCWKAGGHGSEMFEDLLKNSCNPFTVTIASELGTDRFYDYFEAFGFTEKTGVDTSGDFTPNEGVLFMSRDNFSQSDLASYSFGQSFQVSPLQMITAISAVANGGKLMTPYIVSKTVDADCNTITETKPTVRRQVISESTAALIRDNMEQVVATGTGKNAYVAGYHVAGKTGTSEKLTKSEDEAYIASFCGFAPANNPKIAVIIVVDEPKGEHGGGAVAAPLAGEVFEQVLDYMGTEHSYSEKEMELLVAQAPLLTGKTVSEAKAAVSEKDLNIKVVGNGDTVVAQYPDAGRDIPTDGMVVVYTDSEDTGHTVTVPDFNGCTVSEANRIASNSGLNIKISGSSLSSVVYAYKQSIDAGSDVNMGEIITVSFKTTVDVSD